MMPIDESVYEREANEELEPIEVDLTANVWLDTGCIWVIGSFITGVLVGVMAMAALNWLLSAT